VKQDVYQATASEPGRYAIAIRERLAEGAVGLVTTETVCGLVTRALSGIDKLYSLKNRPLTMPVALLVSPDHPIVRWAVRELHFTRSMCELFPGPLTIVIPRHMAEDKLPVDVLSLGYKTYGFRAPYYPPLWSILESVGGMLFATSANYHGRPTPNCVNEVEPAIRSSVDFIFDGGNCPLGHASSVAIFDNNEWDFTRKLPRMPRLFVEWQAQTQPVDKQVAGIEQNSTYIDSSQEVSQRSDLIADDTPFWTEPPLTSMKRAGRIIYKKTGDLTSCQRDMLAALAAWSRVAPVG
jgi:L-threonylcarbamoyladenylate synthase